MSVDARRLAGLLLAVLIVAAGCSATGGGAGGSDLVERKRGVGGGGGGGGGGVGMTATPMATAAPTDASAEAPSAGAGGDGGDADQRFAGRSVIRTGRARVEVDDFDAARRNLTRAVERFGGYVSDSREQLHRVDNETYTTGVLVLRVPQGNFSALMEAVNGTGTVLEAGTDSRDVTGQLVDIEARLRSLRAQREQLRTLYARANDTEAVLKVQRRLSEVQEEIERLEARQTDLERRVALSTVRVELSEPRPEPEPPVPDRWYDVPVVSAFLESVHGVVVVVRAAVVAAAYALPYLLAFGAPLAVAAVVARRYRRRGAGGVDETDLDGGDGSPPDEEAGPDPDDEGG